MDTDGPIRTNPLHADLPRRSTIHFNEHARVTHLQHSCTMVQGPAYGQHSRSPALQWTSLCTILHAWAPPQHSRPSSRTFLHLGPSAQMDQHSCTSSTFITSQGPFPQAPAPSRVDRRIKFTHKGPPSTPTRARAPAHA
ncbi:hypothetical protein MANES_18G144404v8 [Manihot esculenta]|uniref:Uncharacterized protein n=1 Tax=Manihot esculenta TaxID=3983 RepID=A0ACB7G0T7_MANES|nr:hypothetical protein MANES_18G144404v8 [Manihot esculenta]